MHEMGHGPGEVVEFFSDITFPTVEVELEVELAVPLSPPLRTPLLYNLLILVNYNSCNDNERM